MQKIAEKLREINLWLLVIRNYDDLASRLAVLEHIAELSERRVMRTGNSEVIFRISVLRECGSLVGDESE